MRRFYKYWLEPLVDTNVSGKTELRSVLKSFAYHSSAMLGYKTEDGYETKNAFFKKWFCGRYVSYHSFFAKWINKNDTILSLASGRCINELKLLENGYNITCSDLDIPQCYSAAKEIFGQFAFLRLDIQAEIPAKKYDTILCIGLIWAFNYNELTVFFKNTHDILEKNGMLIVELSVSPDNIYSLFYHDVYLRLESKMLQFIAPIFGKKFKRIKEFHGYRYKTSEIMQVAKANQFEVKAFSHCEPLLEFARSPMLNLLIDKSSIFRHLMTVIGHHMPYSRMFLFRKVD